MKNNNFIISLYNSKKKETILREYHLKIFPNFINFECLGEGKFPEIIIDNLFKLKENQILTKIDNELITFERMPKLIQFFKNKNIIKEKDLKIDENQILNDEEEEDNNEFNINNDLFSINKEEDYSFDINTNSKNIENFGKKVINKISNEYNKKEKNNQKENTLSINQRKLLLEGKIREKVNVLKDRYEALEAQNESFHENNTSVENKDKFNQNLESKRKINEIIKHLKNWIKEVKDPNISNERLNELEKKFNDLKNSSANITNVNNNIINSTNEIEKSLLYE